MKLKEEVGLFLNMYKSNSNKLYYATIGKEVFYGSFSSMINIRLLTNEETLPILQTLNTEELTEQFNKKMATVDLEGDGYTFDSFNRFNSIGKLKEVAIGRTAITLTKYDQIKGLLKDMDVNIRMGEVLSFNVGGIPYIITSHSVLQEQSNIFDIE